MIPQRIFLLFFLLQFSAITVRAQAPGYLGHRNSIGYGFYFSPSFVGANPNNGFWNKTHELFYDRVTASKWSVGINARYYKTIYDNKRTLTKEGVTPENYYYLDGLTLAVNFKHFRKNYIAPWGGYFNFGPVLNFVSTSYDPYMHIEMRVNSHDTLDSGFGPERQLFVMGDVMMGWGKSRVIKDHFLIEYGVNFQIFSMLATITDAIRASNTVYTKENYIEETYRERAHGMNRFNLFVKLGYLF